jgi:hypothetical protein
VSGGRRSLDGRLHTAANHGAASPHARHFIIDGVRQKMDFEHICQIVDTVVDLSVHSKRALLHDLAHRAALVLIAVNLPLGLLVVVIGASGRYWG